VCGPNPERWPSCASHAATSPPLRPIPPDALPAAESVCQEREAQRQKREAERAHKVADEEEVTECGGGHARVHLARLCRRSRQRTRTGALRQLRQHRIPHGRAEL